MFKYETHLHTKETSACASALGQEQADRYKEAGYDGIFVTDHFFNANTTVPHDLSWEQRVELYCKGYENAKARGDEIGLKVFFGIEYSYNGADILVYGVDKQWLLDNPDCCDISFYDFARRVHESGGALIHAHPFREADYIQEIKLLPQWVDGVEVYNSGNHHEVFNERAQWYADQYGFRTRTGGTDNHHTSVPFERFSGVVTETELKSEQDHVQAILNGTVRPIIPAVKGED